ncbi:MAG: zinc-ribbon domain-containing protein [Erysipelotrichaceae bacterium]|nr:zinc-ribbon domain-containing protein [Erysipelotrichaceae bacterium]
MDEINKNEIGNMLMNAEGVCPNCGTRTSLLGGLFSAREAGIEDLKVCRCPQCHHIYRYELNEGNLVFSEDITDVYETEVNPDEISAEPEIIRPELDVNLLTDIPTEPDEEIQPVEIPQQEEEIEFDADEDPDTYEDSIIEEISYEKIEDQTEKTLLEEPEEEGVPYEHAEMKICPKCGRSIPTIARYCPYCRKNLTANGNPAKLKKLVIPGIIAALAIALVTAAVLYFPKAAKVKEYNEALKLVKSGEYQQAAEAFDKMGDYQKAKKYVKYCNGVLKFNSGDYDGARELLDAIGSIEDSNYYLSYLKGLEKIKANTYKASDFTSAADDFGKAKNIADAAGMEKYCRALASFVNDEASAADKLKEVVSESAIGSQYLRVANECAGYIDAITRLESGDSNAIDDLISIMESGNILIDRKAGNYSDYIEAMSLYKEGKYYSASVIFSRLDILDSQQMAESCIQKRPSTGIVYKASTSKSVSIVIYDTSDSRDLFVKIYNSSDTLVETLYIRDGGKATAYLPTGSYRFALASGDGSKWYGTKETYGPDGIYQRLKINDSGGEYYKMSAGSYSLKFNVSNGNVTSQTTNYGDV